MTRTPDCGHDARHHAKGLCKRCYYKARTERWRNDPKATEAHRAHARAWLARKLSTPEGRADLNAKQREYYATNDGFRERVASRARRRRAALKGTHGN